MRRFSLLLMIGVEIVSLMRYAAGVFRRSHRPGRPRPGKIPELTEAEKERGIKLTAKGVKYLVHPKKLVRGGPPKDGIPSIDSPKFTSAEEASQWIKDSDVVLAIIYKDVKRVYPLRIMAWHEIVNDTIAGDPVLITYCPLCGSGLAYERKINGEEVDFGVSGKLYNSNLVMYDRKTNSYWSQIEGLAIVSELTGTELTPLAVSLATVVWRDWKDAHPDSDVLSRETGFMVRPYAVDPYSGYYKDSFIFSPMEDRDDRADPKTVMFGIEVDGLYKAYKEDDLKELRTIHDNVGGFRIKIERDEVGVVKVTNLEKGEEIVNERDFWFAWYAFHPYTELYTR